MIMVRGFAVGFISGFSLSALGLLIYWKSKLQSRSWYVYKDETWTKHPQSGMIAVLHAEYVSNGDKEYELYNSLLDFDHDNEGPCIMENEVWNKLVCK